MPLTPDQKRQAAIAHGLNPDEYELDEALGGFVPRTSPVVQPTDNFAATSALKPARVPASALGAGARSFLANIGPTAASIKGGMAAMSAFGAPVAAAFPPASPITVPTVGLLGALASGWAANKAQEAILPEAATQQLAQDAQDQPWASFAGGLASSLPAVRPGLDQLKTAGSGLANLATKLSGVPTQVTPQQVNALANMAVQSAPPIVRGITDENTTPGMAAVDVIANALLSRPTKLGERVLGMSPDVVDPQIELFDKARVGDTPLARDRGDTYDEKLIAKLAADADRARPTEENLNKLRGEGGAINLPESLEAQRVAEIKAKRLAEDMIRNREADQELNKLKDPLTGRIELPSDIEASARKARVDARLAENVLRNADKQAEVDAERQARLNAEREAVVGGAAKSAEELADAKYKEYYDIATAKIQAETDVRNRAEAQAKLDAEIRADAAAREARLKAKPSKEELATIRDLAPVNEANVDAERALVESPEATGPLRAATEAPVGEAQFGSKMPDTTRYAGPDIAEAAKLNKIEDTIASKEANATMAPKTPTKPTWEEQKSAMPKFKLVGEQEVKREMEAPATQELFDYFQTLGAKFRGINTQAKGKIVGQNGQQVRGRAIIQEGTKDLIAQVSTKLGRGDTVGHEQFHFFWEHLKNSPDATLKAKTEQIRKETEALPEYKDWASRVEEPTVDEFIVQKVGEGMFQRVASKNSFDGLKDVFSSLKVKLNKGTVDDYARLMGRKYLFDPKSDIKESLTGVKSDLVGEQQDELPLIPSNQASAKQINTLRKVGNVYIASEPIYTLDNAGDFKRLLELSPTDTTTDLDAALKKTFPEPNYRIEQHSGTTYVYDDKATYERLQRASTIGEQRVENNEKPIASTSVGYQEAITPKAKLEEETPAWRTFGASQVDKVRALGPKYKEVADAISRFFNRKDAYEAKYLDVPWKEARKFSDKDMAAAMDYAYKHVQGEPLPARPNTEAMRWVQKYFREVAEYQRTLKLPIQLGAGISRERGISEYYAPAFHTDETKQEFMRNPLSAKSQKAMNDWADYVVKRSGMDREEVMGNIKTYVDALASGVTRTVDFNALTKAQGYGLPDNLREKDPWKILKQYGTRTAKTFAYWQELQSNARVAGMLRLHQPDGKLSPLVEGTESAAGAQDVVDAMRMVVGDQNYTPVPRINAFIRLVNNALMGLPTGLRDLTTAPGIASQYIPVKDWAVLGEAAMKAGDNLGASLATGARNGRLDMKRFRALESPDEITATLNKAAEAFRKYQGRDALEQASRVYTFTVGKLEANIMLQRAKGGDAEAKRWLTQFGELNDAPIAKWGEAELNQVAKNFVDKTQGTFDARGLSSATVDSALSPFITLQKWGIERFNNFRKDVIEPAVDQGEYTPLLKTLFASTLSGMAIQELNELLSGKKHAQATIKEAAQKENKEYLTAAAINVLQMGSFAGILGDMFKAGADVGVYKQSPRIIGFPAAEVPAELVQAMIDFNSAQENGQPALESLVSIAGILTRRHIQNLNYALNRIDYDGDAARKNAERDLRVFRSLEGNSKPFTFAPSMTGKIANAQERKFKQTEDLQEAATLLPEVLENAKKRATLPDGRIDLAKFTQELRNLKTDQDKTIPRDPVEASRYREFIGEDEFTQRAQQSMKKKAIGSVKDSMVPSM